MVPKNAIHYRVVRTQISITHQYNLFEWPVLLILAVVRTFLSSEVWAYSPLVWEFLYGQEYFHRILMKDVRCL